MKTPSKKPIIHFPARCQETAAVGLIRAQVSSTMEMMMPSIVQIRMKTKSV